jgi:hypothetical protein
VHFVIFDLGQGETFKLFPEQFLLLGRKHLGQGVLQGEFRMFFPASLVRFSLFLEIKLEKPFDAL